jgi:hypothetical protein
MKNEKNENIGKIQIDQLRITSLAEDEIIEILSRLKYNDRIEYDGMNGFDLCRIRDKKYENVYQIGYFKGNDYRILGKLQFNFQCASSMQYVNVKNGKKKIWIDIKNPVFYTGGDILLLKMVIEKLNLSFLHISSIDLCMDKTFDIYERIQKNIQNKKLEVLVNGKVVDKNDYLKEAEMKSSGSLLNPYKVKSYYIKQKKACKDKTKGNYLIMYNKKEEIENSSEKQYILDYYGKPDCLHRIEVHICKEKIGSFLENNNIQFNVDLLTNQSFLKELYDYFRNSILRFRTKSRSAKGRKVKSWNVLLR